MANPHPRDLTGLRFGRLEVLERTWTNKHREFLWRCRCDCGNETVVPTHNLNSGNTTSCGCFGRERRTAAVTTHGAAGCRLYRIWKAMHTRCYNQNSPAYSYYGGRGIEICDEWKSDFSSFPKWASGNGYSDELTIDRVDNNKGYSPDNCRWATMAQQNENKRAKNGFKI